MKEIEKLRLLLPHWIEHNMGHEEDCLKWSEVARKSGLKTVAEHIDAAIAAMKQANDALGKALEEAGGKIDGHHHHHHHD